MALERFNALSEEIQRQAPGFEAGLQIVHDLVASLQERGFLPKESDFLKAQTEAAPIRHARPRLARLYSKYSRFFEK